MPVSPDLSLAEKTLQLVFPGFTFGLDDPSGAERLADMGVGGFCLYGGEASEVYEFTRALQKRAKVPLLFCGDYEDGLPLHVAGGTGFPSNMGVGASGLEDLAFEKGRLTALESRAIGVRWVLAPVLDLATCPENPIVNVRSFSFDPGVVGRLGRAYLKGITAGGALSCIKHFPGHGETREDSHLELPVLDLERRQLLERELSPFRACAEAADSAMMAHLLIPCLGDAQGLPASLSKQAISLLRRDLAFKRVVMTDALSMKAIADNYKEEEACLAALRAGSDVLLVPADPIASVRALPRRVADDSDLPPLVEYAFERLLRLKEACGLFSDRGIAPESELKKVGCAERRKAAEEMAAACLAWTPCRPEGFSLPKKFRYLEPDAASMTEWQGAAFLAELRSLGFEPAPYAAAGKGPVVVAAFLRPQAYTGRIRFSEEETHRAAAALAEAPGGALVSFGSPFVFEELAGWRAGLCAFSHLDAPQKAAARALAGKTEAPGRIPVPLRVLGSTH